MTDSLPFDFDPNDSNPDWNSGSRVHNWRNHVGEKTKGIWESFSPAQRIALALDADYNAGHEHWD